MNVVIWARVSSREQREGYSIDAQLRLDREKARREGWNVVREFEIAESAKRGAARVEFNKMLKWVKGNARREGINAILSHKLDRVCRNTRDAVRLQELEDTCGVRLSFVDNEFGTGPAGALSFNVMAAVAQYYSDNLRTEVLKGIEERTRQGWPHGLAPFGYQNVSEDRDKPVQPHPEKSKTVIRLFNLYATGRYTFQTLAKQLATEGHTYRPSQPRFHRTAVSYVLNNRIYIGEIKRGETYYQGKHRPLIDRATFEACQQILNGKNKKKKTTKPLDHPLAGGLFHCEHCGSMITGERIRRKLTDGGVRVHQYYRCANNSPGMDHPRVRWTSKQLEDAIERDLDSMKLPSQDVVDWFRKSLEAAFSDVGKMQRERDKSLRKRKTELAAMQDRLLNTFLTGSIEETTFNQKRQQLQDELELIEESLAKSVKFGLADVESALAIFDFSQNAAEIWRRSKIPEKRQILESLSLNRTLGDVSLYVAKRKPFDKLAERPQIQLSRGDKTAIELFHHGVAELQSSQPAVFTSLAAILA